MKGRAGVLIKGSDAQRVFDEMKMACSDFYSEIGKYFAAETIKDGDFCAEVDFDRARRRYKHTVYSDMPHARVVPVRLEDGTSIDTRVIDGKAPMHGFLNVEYLGQHMQLGEIVLEWDFPQGRSISTDENFALYFDLVNKNPVARKQERDNFTRYVLSK
jgi:hypothetical protein